MSLAVCVIFGGKSSEHEISCISAYNIISHLNKEKYKLLFVGITKEGESFLYSGDISHIKDGSWAQTPGKSCVISPNPKHGGLLVMNKNGDFFTEHVDVYFPVLHGKNGEDGTIQGVFELSGIPYVGNGVTSSALCMDKILAKKVLAKEGIPITDGFDLVHNVAGSADLADKMINDTFGYPVVVKPANAGSSVGITLVNDRGSLDAALKVASKEDRRALVEKMMDIREIECAVLGNHDHAEASCLGEIIKTTAMYDYDTKYVDDTAGLAIPAKINSDMTETIRALAVRAFYALDCNGLARVDFFVEKNTGEVYLNEINTMPGFTDISMYPMLWQNSGLDYGTLLDKLIGLAHSCIEGR